jgi:DNA-binding PadR family transcriptional regulator
MRVYDAMLRLLDEKALTGYEVLQALEARVPAWFPLGPERVYPVLQMQQDRGHVTAHVEDGRSRYALTDEGRQYLSERPEEEWPESQPWPSMDLPDDVRQQIRQVKGEIRSLARSGMFRRGSDPERLRRVMQVVNQAIGEIKGIVGA